MRLYDERAMPIACLAHFCFEMVCIKSTIASLSLTQIYYVNCNSDGLLIGLKNTVLRWLILLWLIPDTQKRFFGKPSVDWQRPSLKFSIPPWVWLCTMLLCKATSTTWRSRKIQILHFYRSTDLNARRRSVLPLKHLVCIFYPHTCGLEIRYTIDTKQD